MIRDDDYIAKAVQARQDLPDGLLWVMLKSQLYLGLGFVGATVAAIGLKQLVSGLPGRLNAAELALAAVLGVALTVFAWHRAGGVLHLVARDHPPAGANVITRSALPVLLRGYSRG